MTRMASLLRLVPVSSSVTVIAITSSSSMAVALLSDFLDEFCRHTAALLPIVRALRLPFADPTAGQPFRVELLAIPHEPLDVMPLGHVPAEIALHVVRGHVGRRVHADAFLKLHERAIYRLAARRGGAGVPLHVGAAIRLPGRVGPAGRMLRGPLRSARRGASPGRF